MVHLRAFDRCLAQLSEIILAGNHSLIIANAGIRRLVYIALQNNFFKNNKFRNV